MKKFLSKTAVLVSVTAFEESYGSSSMTYAGKHKDFWSIHKQGFPENREFQFNTTCRAKIHLQVVLRV